MMIVEDGSGVFGANSYGTVTECEQYLLERGVDTWDDPNGFTVDQKNSFLVNATGYIEKKYGTRFGGHRLYVNKFAAEATVSFLSQPLDGDSITVGSKVYVFVSTLTSENDVLISAKTSQTIENFIAAVNLGIGLYHPSTSQNEDVAALPLHGRKVILQARYGGEDGDDIGVSATGSAITVNSPSLRGGNTLGLVQPLSFPRTNLYLNGNLVQGIPFQVRQATFELARRASEFELMPDPSQDESGRIVVMKSEKVGPIEETVKFSGYAQMENLIRQYPAADQLLKPFLGGYGSGGVSR